MSGELIFWGILAMAAGPFAAIPRERRPPVTSRPLSPRARRVLLIMVAVLFIVFAIQLAS